MSTASSSVAQAGSNGIQTAGSSFLDAAEASAVSFIERLGDGSAICSACHRGSLGGVLTHRASCAPGRLLELVGKQRQPAAVDLAHATEPSAPSPAGETASDSPENIRLAMGGFKHVFIDGSHSDPDWCRVCGEEKTSDIHALPEPVSPAGGGNVIHVPRIPGTVNTPVGPMIPAPEAAAASEGICKYPDCGCFELRLGDCGKPVAAPIAPAAVSEATRELEDALEMIASDFETDFVLDGKVVDDPYRMHQRAWTIARTTLARVEELRASSQTASSEGDGMHAADREQLRLNRAFLEGGGGDGVVTRKFLRAVPNDPDDARVEQFASLAMVPEPVESDESWEASEALLRQARRVVCGRAIAVFGGSGDVLVCGLGSLHGGGWHEDAKAGVKWPVDAASITRLACGRLKVRRFGGAEPVYIEQSGPAAANAEAPR